MKGRVRPLLHFGMAMAADVGARHLLAPDAAAGMYPTDVGQGASYGGGGQKGSADEVRLWPPEEFLFPFPPYMIQRDFMRELYSTLEVGGLGIFESPTGTVSPGGGRVWPCWWPLDWSWGLSWGL